MPAGMLERYAPERGSTASASTRLFHTLVFGNTGQAGAFVSGDAPAPAAKSAHPPAPSPVAASVATMRIRPRILRNVSAFDAYPHTREGVRRRPLDRRHGAGPGPHGAEYAVSKPSRCRRRHRGAGRVERHERRARDRGGVEVHE